MKRYGFIGYLKPEMKDAYIEAHKKIPERIAELIRDCNIRDYGIFCGGDTLFTYYEYIGTDYDADMKKMAADAGNKKWWDFVCPMFNISKTSGECWSEIPCIFYQK